MNNIVLLWRPFQRESHVQGKKQSIQKVDALIKAVVTGKSFLYDSSTCKKIKNKTVTRISAHYPQFAIAGGEKQKENRINIYCTVIYSLCVRCFFTILHFRRAAHRELNSPLRLLHTQTKRDKR